MMLSFKSFLGLKVKFKCIVQIVAAFQKMRFTIFIAVKGGLETFDINRCTCIVPDWSITRIGFFLQQKYCGCPFSSSGCCISGWKIILARCCVFKLPEKWVSLNRKGNTYHCLIIRAGKVLQLTL